MAQTALMHWIFRYWMFALNKWNGLIGSGNIWTHVDLYELIDNGLIWTWWTHMDSHRLIWTHMYSYKSHWRIIWTQIELTWTHKNSLKTDSYGLIWTNFGLIYLIWFSLICISKLVNINGLMWTHMDSFSVESYGL